MALPAVLAAVAKGAQALAKVPGVKPLVKAAAKDRRVQKILGLVLVGLVAAPVLLVLVFAATAIHVLGMLHLKPTVRLGLDAYRAAEVCPFASDQIYGKALGTAYLAASAYVLTSDNAVQWGAYKNPWGSQVQIPQDIMANVDPAELRAGGSVHDELGLHGDFRPTDWTTVLGWTHLPILGRVPDLLNPLGGEHGVGFLLILPSDWHAWVRQVPPDLSQHLDPYKPYDAFLVMACHLKHLEDQMGIGLGGVAQALVAYGDDAAVQLVNIVVDAVARGDAHLWDIVRALAALITGNGQAFANAVLDFMGLSQNFLGQVGPSAAALADIPANYLHLIQGWAERYGIDWTVLAGVLKVECDFGRGPNHCVSSAGALGPAQFLPSTFAKYHLPGMDNIWDPNDAIAAAANYLKALGLGNPATETSALCAYNGAGGQTCGYADLVMSFARKYRGAPAGGGPVGNPSSAAQAAIRFAESKLGLPYLFGGTGPNAFDCSGLTQAAYAAAGIQIPRNSVAQFDAGPRVPAGQPLMPGDLVFFVGVDPPPPGHVGMAISSTEMIDAPFTGAVIRFDPIFFNGNGYLGATRPSALK
jgi:soluble lytic murein transglycosylase-like protein